MYRFFNITKDTEINERRPNRNEGLDATIKVSKQFVNAQPYNTRILLTVDTASILSVVNAAPTSSWSASLNLYTANPVNLAYTEVVEFWPAAVLSADEQVYNNQPLSWQMGLGRSTFLPDVTEGATWVSNGLCPWVTSSFGNITSSYATYAGGGNWYGNKWSISKTLDYLTTDLSVDIRTVVNSWTSSYDWHGILIKRSDAQEQDDNQYGTLSWFSTDTHTIYLPRVIISWDSSEYATGSNSVISYNVAPVLHIKNFHPSYPIDTFVKMNLGVRPKYPAKTFVTSSDYLTGYVLPSSSYYSIRDAGSDVEIIPFSDCSKISCDASGSFFTFSTHNWQPERYYRVLVKMVWDDDEVIVHDKENIFKLTR